MSVDKRYFSFSIFFRFSWNGEIRERANARLQRDRRLTHTLAAAHTAAPPFCLRKPSKRWDEK